MMTAACPGPASSEQWLGSWLSPQPELPPPQGSAPLAHEASSRNLIPYSHPWWGVYLGHTEQGGIGKEGRNGRDQAE